MPRRSKAGNVSQSTDRLEQEIDLTEYIRGDINDNDKRLFAELAIDRIVNRTLDGKTINGGKFTRYTKGYAEAKGVTQDSVDLFLEGDMLESIEYESDGDKLNLVIEGDEAPKAFNHNTGDTLPKREFFGITKAEAESIARQVQRDVDDGFTLAELRSALETLGIQQVFRGENQNN